MTEHTPGPWKIEIDAWGINVYRKQRPAEIGRVYIAESIQSLPDAHMISAAPEMQEALELCREVLEDISLFTGGVTKKMEIAYASTGAALTKSRGAKS